MNARSLTMLTAVAALFVLAVAGCGSDDEESGAAAPGDGGSLTTSSLSKEEYVKRASAACVEQRKDLIPEISAYLQKKKGGERVNSKNFGPVVRDVVVPVFKAEVAAIRALGAPEGDEEEIEAMLASQEAAIDEVKGLKNPRSFDQLEGHFAQASQSLQDYGFTACVNSG